MSRLFENISQIIIAIIGLISTIYPIWKKKKYILLYIGVALLLVNLSILFWRIGRSNSTRIKITKPKNNADVQMYCNIEGTSNNIPENKKIWIIIYSHSDRKYFPLHNSVNAIIKGDWYMNNVTIGTTTDVNNCFDIMAYLLDEDEIKVLKSDISKPEYGGHNQIPLGFNLFHKITVIRK